MKKVLLVVLSLVLVAALSVGLTMAYLTSKTEVVTNTFTVGKVAITLDETEVTEYGVKGDDNENGKVDRVTGNNYTLIPGHTYVKDPTIHVDTDSEACYVFVKVENGIAGYEAETEEAVNGYKNITTQITNNGWTALSGVSGVYYKDWTSTSSSSDLKVFDEFKIKTNAQDVVGWDDIENNDEKPKIIVTGYAVQKDGLAVEQAWDAVKNQ